VCGRPGNVPQEENKKVSIFANPKYEQWVRMPLRLLGCDSEAAEHNTHRLDRFNRLIDGSIDPKNHMTPMNWAVCDRQGPQTVVIHKIVPGKFLVICNLDAILMQS
jgi:hypothetical protein